MKRWPGITVRGVVMMVVFLGLSTATAKRLLGQQAPDSASQAVDSVSQVPDSVSQAVAPAAPTSSASKPLPGPRLRPDYARVEPALPASNSSSSAVVESVTITITTVALVLVLIIVLLLIAD